MPFLLRCRVPRQKRESVSTDYTRRCVSVGRLSGADLHPGAATSGPHPDGTPRVKECGWKRGTPRTQTDVIGLERAKMRSTDTICSDGMEAMDSVRCRPVALLVASIPF